MAQGAEVRWRPEGGPSVDSQYSALSAVLAVSTLEHQPEVLRLSSLGFSLFFLLVCFQIISWCLAHGVAGAAGRAGGIGAHAVFLLVSLLPAGAAEAAGRGGGRTGTGGPVGVAQTSGFTLAGACNCLNPLLYMGGDQALWACQGGGSEDAQVAVGTGDGTLADL